jgi:hypothetical protein
MIFQSKLLVLISVIVPCVASGQSLDVDSLKKRIYEVGNGALVRLLVTGKLNGGGSFSETGTGFYFQTSSPLGRILTARHVVGVDSQFDKSGDGKIDRRIQLTIMSAAAGPVSVDWLLREAMGHENPSKDIAQVFTNAAGPKDKFRLSARLPKVGDRVWTLSWPDSERAVQPPIDAVVGAITSEDGLLLRLNRQSGAFVKSESGSPVFDDQGAVIAVLVVRTVGASPQPIGFALPVGEFSSFLSDGVVGPTSSETAECVSVQIAKLKASAPFGVEDSVRCGNMGDSQSRIVRFRAPPTFHIVGQVSKNDRTNYGTVGPVTYDQEGAGFVTEVRAAIECKTPTTPFGPGGWAGTTLSGFIEKVVTAEDLERIGRQCRGQ